VLGLLPSVHPFRESCLGELGDKMAVKVKRSVMWVDTAPPGSDEQAAAVTGGEELPPAVKAEAAPTPAEGEASPAPYPATADEEPGLRVQLARKLALLFAPSGWAPSKSDGQPPDKSLQLTRVYGYQGKGAWDNVHYNAAGSIVYFIAGVGVVLSPADNAQRFFLGHNEDITCLAMHPDRQTVATGQTDPKGS
jgi:hypothetical protein